MITVSMKIQFKGLFKAAITAILAFILVDSLVEFTIAKIVGITFIKSFEQIQISHFCIQFYAFNFIFL
jgi:hypothetical protein